MNYTKISIRKKKSMTELRIVNSLVSMIAGCKQISSGIAKQL